MVVWHCWQVVPWRYSQAWLRDFSAISSCETASDLVRNTNLVREIQRRVATVMEMGRENARCVHYLHPPPIHRDSPPRSNNSDCSFPCSFYIWTIPDMKWTRKCTTPSPCVGQLGEPINNKTWTPDRLHLCCHRSALGSATRIHIETFTSHTIILRLAEYSADLQSN